MVAIELSNAPVSCILDLEAPKHARGNPTVRLAIGAVSMLGAIPLLLFTSFYLALLLFGFGLIMYLYGLIENTRYVRARKQAVVHDEQT